MKDNHEVKYTESAITCKQIIDNCCIALADELEKLNPCDNLHKAITIESLLHSMTYDDIFYLLKLCNFDFPDSQKS